MEDGIDRMEKPGDGETRRYNRGKHKGLIEIEIFDEGIIDKFSFRKEQKFL
jgi:hypothetical protein